MTKESRIVDMTRWDKVPQVYINTKLPQDIIETIRDTLTYYVTDYERTAAYKNNEWDGRETCFFTARNGAHYFPIGVYDTVREILEALGYTTRLKDVFFRHSESGKMKWSFKHDLFPYQQEAVLNTIYTGRGGTLLLPTAAGKTTCALKLVSIYDRPTLILVHTVDLVNQWRDAVREYLGIEPAIYGSGKHNEFGLVTIATLQALHAARRKMPDLSYFDVLLVDECHRIPADTAFTTAMRCPAKIRIGLTATPNREDNRQLRVTACTGTVTCSRTPEELIDGGYLAKPQFRFVHIPDWESHGYKKKMTWNDAVEYGILGNAYRNSKITALASEYFNDGKTVLVCIDRIAHGEILQNLLDEESIPCCLLTSDAKGSDRAQTLEEFGDKGGFVMISTLLKEGINIPSMDVIILAAGGKSAIGVIQKIGRVLRVTSEKDSAVVVDFADRGCTLPDILRKGVPRMQIPMESGLNQVTRGKIKYTPKPTPGTKGLLYYTVDGDTYDTYEATVVRNDPDPDIHGSMFSIPALGKGLLYPGVCRSAADWKFRSYAELKAKYGMDIEDSKFVDNKIYCEYKRRCGKSSQTPNVDKPREKKPSESWDL